MYAATAAGVVRSRDTGQTWESLECPVADAYAVCMGGGTLYAGVHPAAMFCSRDGGATWAALTAFPGARYTHRWPKTPHPTDAGVGSIATHPERPTNVIAGVEARPGSNRTTGGVVWSANRGTSWTVPSCAPDDVRDVCCLTPATWLLGCGPNGRGDGGVYRTHTAGRTWHQLVGGPHVTVRAIHPTSDACYVALESSPSDVAHAAVLTSPLERAREGDDESFRPVSYPGEPETVVTTFASRDDVTVAGTNAGTILCTSGEDWRRVGALAIPEESPSRAIQALAITAM